MSSRPNVVLFLCDQLRAFEVGCYGNSVARTPNVDRLAARGARFMTAITDFPVCMAARSSLLTGQANRTATGGVTNVGWKGPRGEYMMTNYPYPGRPHLKDTTLPEALRAAGYHTSAIGKWHIHSWPHDIGFDQWLIPRNHHCHSGQLYTEDGGPEFAAPGWSLEFEVDQAQRRIHERAQSDDPFFLYFNASPPHCPTADGPERITKLFKPEEMPVRPNVAPVENWEFYAKTYRWDYRHYQLGLPYACELPEDYDVRACMAEYYGMTTWVDEALGSLMHSLEAEGILDETIVVFASDHGDFLGSHGKVQKGLPHEESIRIPLVIAGHGVAEVDGVAALSDLAPTLLTLVGADIPETMQGESLWDDGWRGHDARFVETTGGAGVRTENELYFVPFHEGRHLAELPSERFDMSVDPYQMDNLAPEFDDRLDELLRTWDSRTPWMEGSS